MLSRRQIQIWTMGAVAGCVGVAHAGTTPPDYGYQWTTVGDPGNRHSIDGEVPFQTGRHIGSVGYEYRMATTEVTVGQWFEFVQAYEPYYFANTGSGTGFSAFTSSSISATPGSVSILPGESPNRPADMSWEYAARYVNWLHNGKVNEQWAFESGVYDTSTFTENPDGTGNHQAAHNPDADFWIPTLDEWTKAAYWDPSKNNGEGGYWSFANGSDLESLPGIERNSGVHSSGFPLDVGSFPDVQSPWGIFDLAGGLTEWTESSPTELADLRIRYTGGTFFGETGFGDIFSRDQIGYGYALSVRTGAITGLRLVSRVPSPGTIPALGCLGMYFMRRRR